jgi:signal transduction histidine kinase
MPADSEQIRAEQHVTVGSLIQRDAHLVIERWSRQVLQEQPSAQRVHYEALRDHLPDFLWELGRNLAESSNGHACGHCRPARVHGVQRWEAGWSLSEVVQDYQVLRLVLVEYLEEHLERPLRSRELMALGLALDEAIAASVQMYVRSQDEQRAERQREADAALQRQADALKEADRRKDEFLALLGHELRNPLAPLRNALHVLRLQKGDPTRVDWAGGLMERQVQHMTRLVDDLLDITRISRGKITLQRERLDLGQLVREAVEDRRGSLQEAGLALTLDLPAEPLWVEGDPTRLAQVVGNLLHNAIKFTDRGGQVTVRVARDAEGGRAVVTVRDTGIGIEPELLARVFETFMQADRSLERSRSGLGLGLALVKGLVELHGGEVRAASPGLGAGAEFTVWLPSAQAPAPNGEPSEPSPLTARSLRILLVEDNRDSAASLKMLLELFGHQVAVAHSGPAGVETAQRERPDVVLCDLGLPGMSGFAVASQLRCDPQTARARLLAVSGYASESDQQRCREAGFELHLTKPVDPVELQRLLASFA